MPKLSDKMTLISEQTPISEETQLWVQRAWEVRQKNFLPDIFFDFPTQTRSVSLTGNACALNCAHCGGHYLAGMTPVEELLNMDDPLPFRSALISGGCTPEGKVPFMGHLDLLRSLKEKVRLNFHVGLVNDEEIALLEGLADRVSFDFVADKETIREVYGLEREPEDYLRVYRALRRKVPVMPHLTLGLKGGKWAGEEAALEVLEKEGVDGLTLIVFIPTPGTRYAEHQPPKVEEVIEFLAKARVRFPNIPLALGCMRPKGRYRRVLDEAAVALGLNRIVMPTPGARQLAGRKGLKIRRGEECCAL